MEDADCLRYHFGEIKQKTKHIDLQVEESPEISQNFFINRLFSYKRRQQSSGYWKYVVGVYKNLFLMFYFNWTSIITAPISTIAFLTFYPFISFVLFVFEIGLKVFMDFLGGSVLIKHISEIYGQGLSIPNWGAPQLLFSTESQELIKLTSLTLGTPYTANNDDNEDRHRTFDISIAQSLTVLSALIYERQDEFITKAFQLGNDNEHTPAIEQEMNRLIWESENRIRTIARTYGLHFAGVTELKSLAGPFCGLYWPINYEQPFIIVVFKGTTPTNYSEFLVDATLQRVDARTFLFGSAHEGFYDSLFSTSADNDSTNHDPYYSIQKAINHIASELSHRGPVQIWVTGHSLGAALASLLFARLLKSPEDLGEHCQLRDAYVMGCPAIGDNDFAANFASFTNMPLSRPSVFWRLINQSDVVSHIPVGYDNSMVGYYAPSTDFFNYSHIGHAVQITWPWMSKPIKIYPSSYESNLKVNVVDSKENYNNNTMDSVVSGLEVRHMNNTKQQQHKQKKKNLIGFIESMYPFYIYDHLPNGYFEGLERARDYYMQQNHT
ncbi:Alpha/Beta hydrolase protein [Cokeromyces recurvatus]|uniref:Alpha/Beta hydrolase protein n=1 Tax=Cokeromyces recurvatus TaxID=90255 RepID=UPI00221F492C|nr:Alpha/Beta hydrolase protein [Cokeromyces recurvatus]KAI7904234.1 Alpha/Beta hydrolase protein [Cokeromyces recurvatus]